MNVDNFRKKIFGTLAKSTEELEQMNAQNEKRKGTVVCCRFNEKF